MPRLKGPYQVIEPGVYDRLIGELRWPLGLTGKPPSRKRVRAKSEGLAVLLGIAGLVDFGNHKPWLWRKLGTNVCDTKASFFQVMK